MTEYKLTHKDHRAVISVALMRRMPGGDGKHSTDAPAYRKWNRNGGLVCEEWYQRGILHRGRDLPARTHYFHGKKYEYWYRRGVLHRDGGPAFVCWRGDKIIGEEWFCDGVKTDSRYQYSDVGEDMREVSFVYVPPMIRK